MRPTDLAIIVRNDSGQRALFSYGELLFRSPSDVVLAFDAEPVIPKRSCDSCHKNRSDHNWRQVLNRKPVLPRLIAGRDLDADRSLEGVTSIEVAELLPSALQPNSKDKSQPAASQAIEIRDGTALLSTVRSLDSYPRHNVHAVEVGDAMGYHGEVRCEGALLTDVFAAAKAPSGPDVGYVVTAVDGYRMSSYRVQSCFLQFSRRRFWLSIVAMVSRLGEQGAFKVIVANDTIAERWVKSAANINIVRAAPRNEH